MRSRENGFTLVEVMVAMVVFSVALLELGRMQLTAIQVTTTAKRITEASHIAQDRVEQLLAFSYDNPSLVDAEADQGVWTEYTEVATPEGFEVTWRVDEEPGVAGAPDMKVVEVSVMWSVFGREKTLTFSMRKMDT